MVGSADAGAEVGASHNPAYLRRIKVPRFQGEDGRVLEEVFDEVAHETLPLLKDGANNQTRKRIDDAVTTLGGLSQEEVAEWRELLSREPTISNQQAKG